ncbi:MAG TPA: fibronectin type III domain-containing protein, partial [Puia sp.]
MKIFSKAFSALILAIAMIAAQQVNAQSILDPNDVVYTYSSTAAQGSATNPTQPAPNTIGKWVKTTRMGWSTTQWKCYIYNGMPFRLIFPKDYTSAADGKKYPLLVFWHGAGEAGAVTDNENSLAHGGQTVFQANINNGVWDGFILVPQNQNGAWDPSQIFYLKQVTDYMIANNKLDPFHIISNGLSAGGSACWESLQLYPQVFSGTPIFSSNNQANATPTNMGKTKFTPIWDFQGGLDTWPDPNDANIVNNAMIAAGAQYKYTLYPDLGHGTWDRGWAEPDFWPFCNRIYASNPWALHGQTAFCPGVTVRDTLGVAPGFDAYQWAKNDTTIVGATTNTLIVTTYAKYTCRVQRNGIWSDWSHTPIVISIKQPTVTPSITVQGIASSVLPALDNTSVTLQLPDGYATYVWQKVGSSATIGTTNTLTVSTPGQYIAQVTETGGCSSSFGNPFTVVPANGANAPDAASGVLAAPLSQTSVLLNWNQNPSPSYNETGFEVYQASKSGGPYKLSAITGADASKDTITGLTAGTKYYWVIRAVNGNGASAVSNEASAVTAADVQPPTAPGNLSITGTSYGGVSLQWAASSDNVGVTGYDIYVNGNKNYSIPSSQINFSVYSLTNGVSYTFVVKARDQAGNVSTASNQVSGEPLINGLRYSYYNNLATNLSNLPDYSTLTPYKTGTMTQFGLSPQEDGTYFGFVIDGIITAPTTGNYTFQITSDDGSRLYLGAGGSKESPYSYSATPAINDDGLHGNTSKQSGTIHLDAGQSYPIAAAYMNMTGGYSLTVQWKVPGSNSFVTIPASAFMQTSVNNGSAPNAPSDLKAATVDYKSIQLTWVDNSSDETGFELYRAATPTFTDAAIVATIPAGATSYVDSSCAANTRYYYEIRAINNYGSSIFTYSYKEASYDFNSSLIDSTGNNHTLTAVGSTTYDAANKAEGTASIKFNGSNQAMTISTSGSFLQEAYAQRTISVWIKPTNLTSSNKVIFDAGSSTNGLALLLNNSTLIGAVASASNRKNITTTLSNTNWTHVALVYVGDTLQLYVNGTLAASNTNLGFHSVATTTDGARIGQTSGSNAYNTSGSAFNGDIDAVEVFKTGLSAAGVLSVKNFAYAQSNATTQVLPAAPVAPTNLSATATSSSASLTWQDNSTNETGFQVYRSNNNNSSYVLMATLPAGSTSYQDAGLFANATYYYKVNAAGVGGQSAFSNEVHVTTPGVVPVITQIPNQQTRYGITTVIAVHAESSSTITLSASGLPGFATFTDNGDGTGKITLNPGSSDEGNYTGLTVTATTGGGSASTSFNLAINNNYAPTLDSIASYTMSEGDSLSIALHGANVNPADI